ncbi:MAG TPA: DUF3540 domain-containing protein [bacterium]|nr:DUF3540 domain-containing protein [bacterium]
MRTSANVVSLREPAGPALREGRVVSISGLDAVVRMEDFAIEARVAFSCLVTPRAEDLVLCAASEAGEYFILAIIERPGDQDLAISFPADASVRAEQGALAMFSGEALTLASEDRLTCVSGRAVHKSREALVDFDQLTAKGTDLKANYQNVLVIARMINTMARQAIEKFRSYIRHSEDYDQVKAGQMTRKVDGLYAMDSGNTVMQSRQNTKIDGERIFMG